MSVRRIIVDSKYQLNAKSKGKPQSEDPHTLSLQGEEKSRPAKNRPCTRPRS